MKTSAAEILLNELLSTDAYIHANVKVAKQFGINTAVLLSALISKYKYYSKKEQLDKDGFFFNTQLNLEKSTTLSSYQQSTSLRALEDADFIRVKREGTPRRNYFKINFKNIVEFFETPNDKYTRNSCTGTQETQPDSKYTKEVTLKKKLPSEDKSSSEECGASGTRKLLRRSHSQIIKAERAKLNHTKKKEQKIIKVPAKVRSVMNYWRSKGLRISKEQTKAYYHGVEGIKNLFAGSAYNHTEFEEYQRQRFSIRDIRRAIDRFALAALNPHYLPVSQYKKKLRSMDIGSFIYCPFANNGVGRSQFIHYLENEPKTTGTPVEPLEDEHPKLSSALRRAYRKEVLGGVEGELSIVEQNQFVLAAERLLQFMKRNRRKIRWHQEYTPSLLAGWVLSAIKQSTGDDLSKVTPGWFSSEMMFNRRLPAYLNAQALMGEENDNGGGTRVGFLH